MATATVNDATTGTTITEPSGNNYGRDSVTIKVQWGDGSEVEYVLNDAEYPVIKNPDAEGVYYIVALAQIEGTVTLYANAVWNTPLFALSENKRVEVVGEFEI